MVMMENWRTTRSFHAMGGDVVMS
jgi:hypothetical protein